MRRGYTRKSLSEAVQVYPEIIEASRYSHHLPNWQEHFSHVFVLHQNQLVTDPDLYALAVSDALGIPPITAGRFAGKRSNAATEPRSFNLAKVGRIAANSLRRAGFYGIVDSAKKLGLKRLFFGIQSATITASEEERRWIIQNLTEDDLNSIAFASNNHDFRNRT
jgi:hypothetical protein